MTSMKKKALSDLSCTWLEQMVCTVRVRKLHFADCGVQTVATLWFGKLFVGCIRKPVGLYVAIFVYVRNAQEKVITCISCISLVALI